MTETLIPQRIQLCDGRSGKLGRKVQHEPGRNSVDAEENLFMEWQFGTCMYCAQRISRFRLLSGGRWFDQWGNVPESAYVVPLETR